MPGDRASGPGPGHWEVEMRAPIVVVATVLIVLASGGVAV